MADSIHRFSNRVEDYVKYRPSYPLEVFDWLSEHCGLTSESWVADAGSGTGIFSRLLLENGHRVFGIEPNQVMREAAERLLADRAGFTSVNGTAERTQLEDGSVDAITVAQAFHWFDRAACRREFSRILRPGGSVVLLWNERRTDATPFLVAYEGILKRWAIDYETVDHTNIGLDIINAFYAPEPVRVGSFPNSQKFDRDGLMGRVRSSSYTPAPGHPNFQPMMNELNEAFGQFSQHERVHFVYDTKVYCGQMRGDRE